jgi:hypothetical protein
MLSLADKYDTAVLVSGDEDFAYAINAVAYKGVRVELAGFRSNTSPRLIDVADQFLELDSHIEEICKAESRYHNNYHSGSHYIGPRTSGAFTRVREDEGDSNSQTRSSGVFTRARDDENSGSNPVTTPRQTGSFSRVRDDDSVSRSTE